VPSRLPALVTQAVLPRDARLPTCRAKAGRRDETPQAWWCGSPTFILFAMCTSVAAETAMHVAAAYARLSANSLSAYVHLFFHRPFFTHVGLLLLCRTNTLKGLHRDGHVTWSRALRDGDRICSTKRDRGERTSERRAHHESGRFRRTAQVCARHRQQGQGHTFSPTAQVGLHA
jgi:hypothetical protein